MEENQVWRPSLVKWLPLSDVDLAKLGMTTVLEAQAKAMAATALKTLERKSHAEWARLEAMQFRQICDRLLATSKEVDEELRFLAEKLNQVREGNHELRHIVVHASWGIGINDEPSGYDWRRELKLERDDIDRAMQGALSLHVCAHQLVMQVARLIGSGILAEGTDDGAAIKIRIEQDRVVTM